MLLPQHGYYYYVTKAYELKMSRPPLKKKSDSKSETAFENKVMIQFDEHHFLNILGVRNTKPGMPFL